MMSSRHLSLGDAILNIGLHIPGGARSILIWIIDKESNVKQPFSTALLRHYVGGSGMPYDLNSTGPIPPEWQRWIVRSTNARPGKHHLDPYHAIPIIPDLKNSLGHFDVTVKEKSGVRVKAYEIQKDSYHFGYKLHDVNRTHRHGFELPFLSDDKIKEVKALLPTRKYRNPGGFVEGFEVAKVHGTWTVYVPQEVAARAGKPFMVYGRFEL